MTTWTIIATTIAIAGTVGMYAIIGYAIFAHKKLPI